MQAIGRALPADEYMDISAGSDADSHDKSVAPCADCEHRALCIKRGTECLAFKDYVISKAAEGGWRKEDRNPFVSRRSGPRAAGKPKSSKNLVYHNGHAFRRGTMQERLYLLLKELGPKRCAEVQEVLKAQDIKYERNTLRSILQQVRNKGAAECVDGLWVAC